MPPSRTHKIDSQRLTYEQRIELYTPYLDASRGYKWIHSALTEAGIHIPRPTIKGDIRRYRKQHPKDQHIPPSPQPSPPTDPTSGLPSPTTLIPPGTQTQQGDRPPFDWHRNMESLGSFVLKRFMAAMSGKTKCPHCGGAVEVVKDAKEADRMIDKYTRLYSAWAGSVRILNMIQSQGDGGVGDLTVGKVVEDRVKRYEGLFGELEGDGEVIDVDVESVEAQEDV